LDVIKLRLFKVKRSRGVFGVGENDGLNFLLSKLFRGEEGEIGSHWIYKICMDLVGSKCDW
jgi:hypothetical protein